MSRLSAKHNKLIAAVLLSGLATGWFLLSSSSNPAEEGEATATSIPDQNRDYSVFDRATTEADEQASKWRLPDTLPAQGIDMSSARIVLENRSTVIAAVKSNVGPCLVKHHVALQSFGLSCPADPAVGKNQDPSATAASVGYGVAVGVVPDTVKNVDYTLSGGGTERVAVHGNVWKAPADATKVTFTINGQAAQIELLPAGALPKGAKLCSNGLVMNSNSSCDLPGNASSTP